LQLSKNVSGYLQGSSKYGEFQMNLICESSVCATGSVAGLAPLSATLEGVVEYYDCGGNRNPHLDTEPRPLHLSMEERRDLGLSLCSLSAR